MSSSRPLTSRSGRNYTRTSRALAGDGDIVPASAEVVSPPTTSPTSLSETATPPTRPSPPSRTVSLTPSTTSFVEPPTAPAPAASTPPDPIPSPTRDSTPELAPPRKKRRYANNRNRKKNKSVGTDDESEGVTDADELRLREYPYIIDNLIFH